MDSLRKALLIVIAPFLTLLLFATAIDWGIVNTVGQPTDVKKIVADSGIYKSVVPNLLNQAKTIDTDVGQIPANDPTVMKAAEQSLTPQDIQKNTEAAIDSIYAWLEGKTAQPNFKIDLTGSQASFADNLASAVQNRIAGLPKCTTAYTASSFDAYNATCLPPGVNPSSIANELRSSVNSGDGFIGQPVVTSSDIKNGGSNQPVFESNLKNLPKQYQRAKKTPYILAVLTLLAAAAIILLSADRWRGLRRVGLTVALVGLLMLVFAFSLNRANTNIIQPRINIENAALQQDVRNIITDIVQRVDKNYWTFGGIYTALGVIALATPLILHRAGKLELKPAANSENETPEDKPAPAKDKS